MCCAVAGRHGLAAVHLGHSTARAGSSVIFADLERFRRDPVDVAVVTAALANAAKDSKLQDR